MMAYSSNTFVGDGSTTTFTLSFANGYLNQSDVSCRVGSEVDVNNNPVYRTITWINASMVSISGAAPGDGVDVLFRRTTPKTVLEEDYVGGAEFTSADMNTSLLQLLMICQEILDGYIDNSAQVVGVGSSAITSAQLAAAVAALQAQITTIDSEITTITGTTIPAETATAVAAAEAAVASTIAADIAAALTGLSVLGSGVIVQHVYAETTAQTVCGTMPVSNSVPTTAQGTQILSVSITPQSSTNKLKISFLGEASCPDGTEAASAVFVGSACVDAKVAYNYNRVPGTYERFLHNYVEVTAGSTSPLTISVNIGDATGSVTLNSNYAGAVFGGASRCTLTVEEVEPTGSNAATLASEIDAASTLSSCTGTELVPMTASGTLKNATTAHIAALATATTVGLGNVNNVAQLPLSYLDTTGTLAADSDVKVPSQKAVVTYVAAQIAAQGGINATITTAKLTGGGSNGSMTFVNGVLTAETPAT